MEHARERASDTCFGSDLSVSNPLRVASSESNLMGMLGKIARGGRHSSASEGALLFPTSTFSHDPSLCHQLQSLPTCEMRMEKVSEDC